ncbi:hypothetical protein LTR56_010906 [Elasticomyces elasticus]|nr:hypothetical protein LTR56_010906 [Elasticomyces elasticus]KAK3662605.1 hypothetical protein LTR22_006455 [Elasticomyces elasticus]KAK4926611.1 hypothetical protein LTR49_006545 [Elasticomyces elasticus]KAK5760704.1 hypothetical protein LTS12_009241 [Elasticomyces elasticus]
MAAPLRNHYARLLTRWPVDLLRPEKHQQFQTLLKSRITPNTTSTSPSTSASASSSSTAPSSASVGSESEVNAAYLLLDNSLTKLFPMSRELMEPKSNPTHYSDLAREIDEAPGRTWWGGVVRKMRGMVRLR